MLITLEKNKNLDLSFNFYTRSLNDLLEKFYLHLEEKDLNKLKKGVKSYLLDYYASQITTAKNYYYVFVSFDIDPMISTYDYLDILFSFNEESTRKLDLNLLITVNNFTTFSMKRLLMLYIKQLTSILAKKIEEEYRVKYGLDTSYYAEQSYSCHDPIARDMAYPALFDENDESHSLANFLELENNFDNLHDSAKFYKVAFNKQVEKIYLKYGLRIEGLLNSLLNQAMANRKVEVSSVHRRIDSVSRSSYSGNFIYGIFDVIQSFIIDRSEFYKKYNLSFKDSVIDQIITEANKSFGLEIEQDLRDLFSYELLLENLAIEVYGLYQLSEKGTLTNLEFVSYQATINSLKPSFVLKDQE